ncbi:MAG: DeoR/GlpR family DNA-binding transcription regulator [Rhodobacteraceae bacterium]|nr:DeoR/GlpR family DNA-binding transcription regulator [Paracoccaceae bacterium]
MSLSFRHQQIIDTARKSGRVLVDDLSELLRVTPQTIRRDLNDLCDQGHLARVHGGAVLESGVANMAYEARRNIAADVKKAIGALCAAEIPDDASMFINIGTTTEAVARALNNHRNIMVITNNLNIANILADNPHCDVVVTGGMLRRSDGGLVGESTVDTVQQFKADIAIIGVSAIDEDGALLDFDYREVRVAQAIIANARRVFLVSDSSKLERSAPIRIGHISEIDSIFTDKLQSEALRDICKQHGVNIRIANT